MYCNYLNLNTCLSINILIMLNILAQLVFKSKKNVIKPIEKEHVQTNFQKPNDHLSNLFYQNSLVMPAKSRASHQTSLASCLNNRTNSIIDSRFSSQIPVRSHSTASLADFRSTYRQQNSSIIKPAMFNLKKDESFMVDNRTYDRDDDDSSSIISGMTNLYLEKTNGCNVSINDNNFNQSIIKPARFDSTRFQYAQKSNIYMKGL
jgi:hypothetical protein